MKVDIDSSRIIRTRSEPNSMEWDLETLGRLHRIFSDRSWQIAAPILNFSHRGEHNSDQLAWQAWIDYISSIGLKMEFSCNKDYDDLAPRLILKDDGFRTIRIINMWGDRYIDIPEEFALKILALGFLP